MEFNFQKMIIPLIVTRHNWQQWHDVNHRLSSKIKSGSKIRKASDKKKKCLKNNLTNYTMYWEKTYTTLLVCL